MFKNDGVEGWLPTSGFVYISRHEQSRDKISITCFIRTNIPWFEVGMCVCYVSLPNIGVERKNGNMRELDN